MKIKITKTLNIRLMLWTIIEPIVASTIQGFFERMKGKAKKKSEGGS